MNRDQINTIAYLNTMESNRKPFDIILKIIEIECYNYTFSKKNIYSDNGVSIKEVFEEKYSLKIEEYVLKHWITTKFNLIDRKLQLIGNKNENLDEEILSIREGEKAFLDTVSKIRLLFIEYAKKQFNKKYTQEETKTIFDGYIYCVTTRQAISKNLEADFYIFKKFLSFLYRENREYLDVLENFGIANQIQDLVINGDIDDPKFLENCVIFLDTPILMKRFGYDGIEFLNLYESFFDDLIKAGAVIKVFEHTFEELWGILFNYKRCIAQGILDAKGVNDFLRARKDIKEIKNYELSLEKENVRRVILECSQIEEIVDIADVDALDKIENFSDCLFDEKKFEEILIKTDKNYEKYRSRKEKDTKSLASIARLRRKYGILNTATFKSAKYFLLVDNYALVNAIREYYSQESMKPIKNELLLESSIIFSLWQNLSNKDNLNRALFRSKCFALNPINEEFKETLYREARKLEAYTEDINITDEIIFDPAFEDEVYEKILIKPDEKLSNEYLSRILRSTIEQREKDREKKYQEKEKQLHLRKDMIIRKEKETEEMVNHINDIVEERIEKSTKKTETCLQEYRIKIITQKSEALSHNFWYKFMCLFSKNRKQFFWDKACEIIGETVPFPEGKEMNE